MKMKEIPLILHFDIGFQNLSPNYFSQIPDTDFGDYTLTFIFLTCEHNSGRGALV